MLHEEILICKGKEIFYSVKGQSLRGRVNYQRWNMYVRVKSSQFKSIETLDE